MHLPFFSLHICQHQLNRSTLHHPKTESCTQLAHFTSSTGQIAIIISARGSNVPPPTSTAAVLTDVNWIGIGFTTVAAAATATVAEQARISAWGLYQSIKRTRECWSPAGKRRLRRRRRGSGERQRRLTNDWDFVGLLGCWGSGMGLKGNWGGCLDEGCARVAGAA